MSSLWLLPAYAIYKYNITEVIIIIYPSLWLLPAFAIYKYSIIFS